jgi:hypothetical protein
MSLLDRYERSALSSWRAGNVILVIQHVAIPEKESALLSAFWGRQAGVCVPRTTGQPRSVTSFTKSRVEIDYVCPSKKTCCGEPQGNVQVTSLFEKGLNFNGYSANLACICQPSVREKKSWQKVDAISFYILSLFFFPPFLPFFTFHLCSFLSFSLASYISLSFLPSSILCLFISLFPYFFLFSVSPVIIQPPQHTSHEVCDRHDQPANNYYCAYAEGWDFEGNGCELFEARRFSCLDSNRLPLGYKSDTLSHIYRPRWPRIKDMNSLCVQITAFSNDKAYIPPEKVLFFLLSERPVQ